MDKSIKLKWICSFSNGGKTYIRVEVDVSHDVINLPDTDK